MKFVRYQTLAEHVEVSMDFLTSLMADGTLIAGTHYVDIRKTGSMKPVYRFNLPALLELWKTPPADRAMPLQKPRRKSAQ